MGERARVRESREKPIRNWTILFSAALIMVPAALLWLATRLDVSWATSLEHSQPWAASIVFGVGIVGAAFLLTWAAEAAQVEISAGLAVAAVALLTVLPEYAVSMTFTWKAGADPGLPAFLQGLSPESEFLSLPVANVTGANRLLSGLGWPLVIFLYWLRARRVVKLTPSLTPEIVVLGLAAAYSALIFLRAQITLVDAGVLLTLFALYLWLISKTDDEGEKHLLGPPAAIAALRRGPRRLTIIALFAIAGAVIGIAAEPFADGLVETGLEFNIERFILVQWLAPLASEAPEILVAVIFTLRGNPVFGMAALVSAATNQWTLLVASLPVVFSIAAGQPLALPLDERATAEVFLTMAQILFAVVLIMKLHIGWIGASILFVAFVTHLLFNTTHERYVYGVAFLVLTMIVLIVDREHVRSIRARGVGFGQMVRERAGL